VHFRTGIANSAANRTLRLRQGPPATEVILRCRTGQPAYPSIGSAVSPDFTTPPRPGVFAHLSLEMELTSVIPSVPLCFRRGLLALVMATAGTAASAQIVPPAPAPGVAAQQPTTTALTTPTAPVGPVRKISIDEAVTLALEQNVSLQVQRMTPGITELDVVQSYAQWLPNLTGQFRFQSLEQPVATTLQSGSANFQQDQWLGFFGVDQFLPTGGDYSLGYQALRNENNNQFATLNPNTQGNLTFSFNQPLLRNRSIDATRQQILVSKNNLAISEMDFRNTVVSTVRDVKNAYWDLVVAQSALAVQRTTLELSLQTLGDNKKRVEVGTMAPIDIVQAEAEVASNEENVIIGEQTVAQAQDQLRALVLEPTTPDFWNTTFETTDAPSLATTPVDVDAAVAKAMAGRLDLQQARKQLESNDIRLKYFQNQTLPDISAAVNYGLAGLGGTVLTRDGSGLNPGDVTSTTQIPYSEVLRDVFGFAFPTWSVGVNVSYPIGRNGARVNVERQRLTNEQNLLQLRDLERQVVQQVRDLARQVNTNLKRVATTQAARALAERRLEAEQKKFGVGLSTTFNVLQAQRDLAEARNNEQRAILDFEKSRVDFEAAQEASISGAGAGSLTLGGAIGQGTGSTGSTTGVTQGAGRVGQNR
jgi:outer membrane protein